MKNIIIKCPIWSSRSIGIADYKIIDDLKISIAYRTSDGKKLYPDKFYIKRNQAKSYPVQYTHGVKLRIIPIDDLLTNQEDLK